MFVARLTSINPHFSRYNLFECGMSFAWIYSCLGYTPHSFDTRGSIACHAEYMLYYIVQSIHEWMPIMREWCLAAIIKYMCGIKQITTDIVCGAVRIMIDFNTVRHMFSFHAVVRQEACCWGCCRNVRKYGAPNLCEAVPQSRLCLCFSIGFLCVVRICLIFSQHWERICPISVRIHL